MRTGQVSSEGRSLCSVQLDDRVSPDTRFDSGFDDLDSGHCDVGLDVMDTRDAERKQMSNEFEADPTACRVGGDGPEPKRHSMRRRKALSTRDGNDSFWQETYIWSQVGPSKTPPDREPCSPKSADSSASSRALERSGERCAEFDLGRALSVHGELLLLRTLLEPN